ncbi:DNA-processing protein DprA [Marinobacter lipolyticus]|uniref:DNA-processing protein DprA n=1 Tax=Marinobacter lipolyticus TaxID=209639 RepID=UPI003A8E06B3
MPDVPTFLTLPEASSDIFHCAASPWLMLSCLPKFGVRRRQAALSALTDLTALLGASVATLKAIGLTTESIEPIQAWQRQDRNHPVVAQVLRIWNECRVQGIRLITPGDDDYPEPLRHIHDAPLVLYCLGRRDLLARDQIGMVGSRNATRAGLDHARKFAAALGDQGFLVTSGLALGIDGAAHAGALDAGHPTLAVIGSGFDRLYPSQHRKLAERIIDQGLLISEYPPGVRARAAHFPQRNRIISGMSRGVLVVEAGLKSGSLITARLALEQGREVFAIPGSVHSPVARGCHHLIKQGARLVETVDDVLEELGAWWSPSLVAESAESQQALATDLDAREIAVLKALGYDPQSTDQLCSETGLPADQLMQSLLLLELQGLVSSVPGGFQKIA